ncbi:Predicted lipoprotein with conserved Yx(FWY)xxD motif [Streptomyces sp. 2231.1]|uniref:SCO0930 family lipoprotein n=1 Tax=Streptomyces sp. 2231.1 TaxID=1855347 RepID=UPI00089D3507|nr:SCO0930 family lipoprotein [Streptomyces sp. 2231.1]SEE12320.1 Predicted lipoprotein with conserved Yx(FWY)xxD motif [Streptomyces sp. 2231.1]
MKTSWRAASLVATAASVLALTTACGQDKATTPAASAQNVGATAAADGYGNPGSGTTTGAGNGYGADGNQASDSGAKAVPAGKLTVSDNADLGKVLTDGSGLTLYRFDKDTANPPKTNCDGDCATTWPPVPADDATAGAGIDKALLGEVTRPDGSKQLTIGGWPAYRYAKDVNPGDVNGQGVGGKWYALAPNGKKASLSSLPGLSVRKDAKLGDVVVDKNGMTVYRFMKDQAWPKSVSNCLGACLEKWPAVAPVSADDTKGVKKKGLMPFTRSEGKKQMSVNCWPIYTFSGDKAPGDTNGQGVGGTWYAVSPDGKPVGVPGN